MRYVYNSLSEIPESIREHYVEKDGHFELSVEGDIPGMTSAATLAETNAKLAEFRDNNRTLNADFEAFKRRYEGVDLDEYKKLKDKIEELEKRGVKGGDDVTSMVQKAIENAVTPLQKQLEEISLKEKTANEALQRKELESMLSQAGLNAGVVDRAMPDYLRRGLETFSLEDGRPVARNGDAPLYSKVKLTDPLGIDEWASGLLEEAPHLFKSSKGGGSGPGPGGNGDVGTYDRNDPQQVLANVDKIADGKVVPKQTF